MDDYYAPGRCASVVHRPTASRRISAAELESLMIRQNTVNSFQPIQQYDVSERSEIRNVFIMYISSKNPYPARKRQRSSPQWRIWRGRSRIIRDQPYRMDYREFPASMRYAIKKIIISLLEKRWMKSFPNSDRSRYRQCETYRISIPPHFSVHPRHRMSIRWIQSTARRWNRILLLLILSITLRVR